MKFLSVCSGIEAASVAWHDLGFECVGVSEIEKFTNEVLKYHYPSVPNLGDMTNFKEWNDDLAPDLLVGGTPCQSFSVAGLRKGMDDPRGNLALTYVAIAEKYKPRWFIWENVPGVLSSNSGKDFASFLTAMAEIGYGIAYRVLDAQFFGVPQRRRRVFVVGYLGDWRPATAVLLEPTSVFGNTPKGRKTRKGITASAETNPRKAVPYDLYQITAPINRQNREVGDPCHTLAKDNAAHASIVEIKESSKSFVRQTENTMRVRRLTPVECERLQGFPDNWTQIPYGKRPKEQCPDGHRYKALGNSMAVPVMRWIGRRIALFESLKA
jgi:DNA (cytosine-5)-methyltransferase 1